MILKQDDSKLKNNFWSQAVGMTPSGGWFVSSPGVIVSDSVYKSVSLCHLLSGHGLVVVWVLSASRPMSMNITLSVIQVPPCHVIKCLLPRQLIIFVLLKVFCLFFYSSCLWVLSALLGSAPRSSTSDRMPRPYVRTVSYEEDGLNKFSDHLSSTLYCFLEATRR